MRHVLVIDVSLLNERRVRLLMAEQERPSRPRDDIDYEELLDGGGGSESLAYALMLFAFGILVVVFILTRR